jgi:hypothetical protein
MVELTGLWLPIVLSAVLVFVVSSIIHMVMTYHRADVKGLPSEAKVADALRPFAIPPGDYMIPHGEGMAAMKDPAFQEKLAKGPVAIITVLPNGPFAMGKSLGLWFALSLVISLFAGYIASRAVQPGWEYLDVFRFVGTTAFVGYGVGLAQQSIWGGKNWGATLRSMFDGLIYALVTAGVFGWLWPN